MLTIFDKNFSAEMTRYKLPRYSSRNGSTKSCTWNKFKKFFEIKNTSKHGITIVPIQNAIDDAMKNFCYFTLFSNEIKDTIGALDIYRNKVFCRDAYVNLKERPNFAEWNCLPN